MAKDPRGGSDAAVQARRFPSPIAQAGDALPARGLVALDDGVELWVEARGSGPPVVLIHGNMLSSAMWEPQLAGFAGSYTVISYDVRGFGRSRYRPGLHSDFADLRALLQVLGVERPHLVGLSMGASIAVEFALDFPGIARSLVLTPGGALGPADPPWMAEGWQRMDSAVNAGDYRAARDVCMDFPPMQALRLRPAVRDAVAEMIDAHPWRESAEKWAQYQSLDPPARERLRELDLPVLVVSGDLDDETFFEEGGVVTDQVRGARKVVISGAGHMVNLEAPDEYNAAVLAFLRDVDGPR